jgi:CheY-like chemotaxis protein
MLILAVDDDRDDLDLFCDAVKEIDSSIDLISAHNAENALDYLLKNAVTLPDFVFLDINMPRVDGRECLKMIRREKLTRNLPVIMYSTSLSPPDEKLFEELNAKFLKKASTQSELLSSLKVIFDELKVENDRPHSFV